MLVVMLILKAKCVSNKFVFMKKLKCSKILTYHDSVNRTFIANQQYLII